MAVNDFTIHVATQNGSGSQSSNLVLMRSVFNMGIPVCGKNLFPSNIQGMPTWFTTRINKDGYTALSGHVDVLVGINKETLIEDIRDLPQGAVVITEYADDVHQERQDLTIYHVPFTKLASDFTQEFRMRKFLLNMIYVGVLKQLFSIDTKAIEAAVLHQFKTKPKAVESNLKAIDAGADFAKKNLKKIDPFSLKKMNKTKGKILMEGNAACSLGALNAGCTFLAWYPITPSSSVCEKLTSLFHKYRVDKDGKNKFAVIQAEDEIAALGMVVGAGWTGARAMTASAGPGLSLMAEMIGLAYFTETPIVVMDIQRVGPSTGMPTRTSQGDILFLAYHSHGDTKHPLLIPGNMTECYEFSMQSFDIAEKYQCPVFVLSDLDLGMNYWITDPLKLPTGELDRGKVLDEKQLAKVKNFQRYGDPDGDGIPYRILPGTKQKGDAYLTRGSGHNANAGYTEKGEEYEYIMDRLARKLAGSVQDLPEPLIEEAGSDVGVIYYGSTAMAVHEALDALEDNHNMKVDRMRIRSFPFHDSVREFINNHKRIYIVEMNRDAQMKTLLGAEIGVNCKDLIPITHYDGYPLYAQKVVQRILDKEGKS